MWCVLLIQAAFLALLPGADASGLVADPAAVSLDGRGANFQLLVSDTDAGGKVVDKTRAVTYRSVNPDICQVSPTGFVSGVSNGAATIEAEIAGKKTLIQVTVSNLGQRAAFNFERDIIPILSRYGCNSSACHAKAEGQNGFKLSVFGFDPKADHLTLTQESRGRRTHPLLPEQSLLLVKASGGMPHGGGVRIKADSVEYSLLRDWIAGGMPFGQKDDPQVKSIEVSPRERQLTFDAQQQLRVIATYTDGRRVDVTTLAKFQSNNEGIAAVDDRGFVVAGKKPGDVAVMASFMGSVDIFRALIPQPSIENAPAWPVVKNQIDELVDAKLRKLGITPSGICSDADYLRRVYLDLIGTLPTAAEARAFLADTSADKRQKLVDQLLTRPEYADYWALKWSDLLRVDRQVLGQRGAFLYYSWIRESFASNKHFDQFVRELLTADGELAQAPAAHLFKAVTKPGDRASTISQVFLGVRIECAQCHHHPFDRWGQDDYVGMEAFFVQPNIKKNGRGEVLFTAANNSPLKHPRTGDAIHAHALGEAQGEASPEGDRRKALAAWMTSPGNAWFAKSFANRMWAHFTGRGLVTPIDDVRLTNPPSNPELLDALAKRFTDSGFDVQALVRFITSSRTYQLTSATNPTNLSDEQNYSRALLRSLDAEVLFDAVCQTTGVPEKFDGLPAGYRAIQLWDSHVPHYFLRIFGRPVRATVCDCERNAEPSVAQVLHVMNSPLIQDKLAHEGGRITKLATQMTDDAALIDELYLTFYARPPSADERAAAIEYFKKQSGQRRRAVEDLAWSLMNTTEFLFNH